MTEKREDWKATAITKSRLNGLKLDAEAKHRSVGGHLEHLLETKCGIPKLTDTQYQAAINKLRKEENKK